MVREALGRLPLVILHPPGETRKKALHIGFQSKGSEVWGSKNRKPRS